MASPHAPIVVDTNILFSALLRNETRFAAILKRPEREFVICESILVELFRHKEKILASSDLGEEDVLHLFYDLLRALHVRKEDAILPHHREKAFELCRDVDPADAPVVALALSLDAYLWTGDRRLRRGLQARGFDRFYDPGQDIG